MTRADVVVIGGGPAGAAAAIGARAAGLRVVVVERDAVPRLRPGESVHPGVEPLLARLGVLDDVLAANFVRHEGHWVQWGREPARFVPFGRDERAAWRGFQLWRPTFDAIMQDRVVRAGALLQRPCRDAQPIVESGRVVGVRASAHAIHAPYVIDATGRHRWLSRALGLRIRRLGPPMVAWFGYAEGQHPAGDAAPALVADDGGWTWTARVRDGLYQWVRLSPHRARPPRGWCPEPLASLRPVHGPRGMDVGWTDVRPAAGPGYFLVGDSAFVLDPASSHGMLKALMSGMMAAHCAAAVLGGEASAEAASRHYDAWAADWFWADCQELRRRYRTLGDTWSSFMSETTATETERTRA